MLQFINSIPESIGWVIVGASAMLCVVMAIKVGKTFVEMWREWHTEEEEILKKGLTNPLRRAIIKTQREKGLDTNDETV